jgi:hypothetical protein
MNRAERIPIRISLARVVVTLALLGCTPFPGGGNAGGTSQWQTYFNSEAGLSFKYPSDWKVEDEGFYETAGGVKSDKWSLIIYRDGHKEDSNDWIRFNPRQFQVGDGQCIQVDANDICTYSNDAQVLSTFRKVAATTKVTQPGGAHVPPRGSEERKAILDALRKEVGSSLPSDVIFVVGYLKVHGGWAWIETAPQSPDGTSRYEDVSGLLSLEQGHWKVQHLRPCCGECADDPVCADDRRYFRMLHSRYPAAPADIFPQG